jgi:hypothetical protein
LGGAALGAGEKLYDQVVDYLADKTTITVQEILEHCLHYHKDLWSDSTIKGICRVLRDTKEWYADPNKPRGKPRRWIRLGSHQPGFKPSPKEETYVYVIQARDTVKIGVSLDPWSRLDQLQTGNPYRLRLIAVLAGDGAAEQRLKKPLLGIPLGE